MKRSVLVLMSLAALAVSAQPTLPPPTPAAQLNAAPALPMPSPALPPGFTTTVPSPVTNATNASVPNLLNQLTNLQVAVEQALPPLANFNNGLDFVALGTSGVAQLLPDPGTNTAAPFVLGADTDLARNATGINIGGGSVAGTLVMNANSAPNLNRAQATELLILQSDLERVLPILSALNGLPPGGTNAFSETNTVPLR